eukprot:1709469-Pyramimonas_sp.AAC.1
MGLYHDVVRYMCSGVSAFAVADSPFYASRPGVWPEMNCPRCGTQVAAAAGSLWPFGFEAPRRRPSARLRRVQHPHLHPSCDGGEAKPRLRR